MTIVALPSLLYCWQPGEVEARLPVMVYIHGGRHLYEGISMYPATVFMDYDVIYVGVQYRLGLLGEWYQVTAMVFYDIFPLYYIIDFRPHQYRFSYKKAFCTKQFRMRTNLHH